MDRTLLEKKALAELREIASTLELRGYQRMKKADLVDLIVNAGGNGVGDAGTTGQLAIQTTDRGNRTGGDQTDGDGARTDGSRANRSQTTETEPAGNDLDTARGHDGSDGGTRQRTRARRRDTDDSPSGDRDDGQRDNRDNRDDRPSRAHDHAEGRSDRGDGRGDGGDDPGTDKREGADGPRDRERARQDTSDGHQRDRGDRDDGQERGDDRGQQDRGQQGGQGQQGQRDDQGGRNRNKRERRRKGRGSGQQQQQENLDDAEVREGVLDLLPEGYGFLRCTGYLSGNKDVYVSQSFVRRFDLRRGDRIAGPIRRNKNNDKFPALARVDTIEGEKVGDEQVPKRVEFKDLTPLFPEERLPLEVADNTSPMAMRLVDMMAPIGKGQRGLLVSPPKAGKTTVLKQLAHSIEANNPEVHLMVLLVDERPEEVTDFERSTAGEVISSTFDRPAEDHTQVAELCIERAKRLVERGRDVVILLDSITRLGRAYNLAAPASGRILSGGIDSAALYPPKRFFGAARNIEEGGSLTIIASALIETGSKMDEVIFEEFKGTGNMELRLDRRMEQKRIFPAIDIQSSGTRREELLLHPDELATIWKLRRLLSTMDAEAALQLLIDKLRATKSNSQFLQMIAKSNLQ